MRLPGRKEKFPLVGAGRHSSRAESHTPESGGQALLPLVLTGPSPRPQQQRLAHLEEKLRLLAQARDEAHGACLQQRQTAAEAQARASQLGLQAEGLRRRLEELQQVAGTPRTLGLPLAPQLPSH